MSYSRLNPAWDRMRRTQADAEVQPPRCVKCGEPVGLNKRDCACTRAAAAVERNMYGCTPCPRCGGVHRYPWTDPDTREKYIVCGDCPRLARWDGTWADDGYSVDELPEEGAR